MDDAGTGTAGRGEVAGSDDPGLVHDQLISYARDLREALARSRRATEELQRTHLETVAALASAIDVRDDVTGGHVQRVANYGAILARRIAPELVDDPQLVYGFLLHDIGKMAIPDAVLNKPSGLDADERDIMRGHVRAGVAFVKSVGFLRPALNLIATHHEHFDGSGYPQRLVGEEIPLSSRMFIVCDAFDAMTHDRPYRGAMTPDEAIDELRLHRGGQFDPDVVDAFVGCATEVLAVPERPGLPAVRGASVDIRPHRDALGASAIFDAVDQAIVLLSPEGTVVDANERFLELLRMATIPLGMSVSEVVRRSSTVLVDAEGAGRSLRRLETDLLGGRRSGEVTTRDGRRLTWSSNVLRSDEGQVSGRVVVIAEAPHG